MMNIFWLMSFLMVFMGIFSFISNRKHLLSMLLSLEFIILMIYFLLFMYLNFMGYSNYFCLLFLTFSVCEGALGLSILVSMIRSHGNDYFQSFNIL